MAITQITRRAFLNAAAVLGLTFSLGCPPRQTTNGVRVFKRSGRGKHVSQAAKKHNANRLYRTRQAALSDVPHPGDKSAVVEILINKNLHAKLFPGSRQIADLRKHL